MAAHVARHDMAWIDWRQPRCKKRNKRRLWALQMKGDLVVAVGGDLLKVAVPGLAWVDAKLLARPITEQVPGAFDVLGAERLAVVPSDALAQREGQLGAILVPRPVGREVGHDRAQAVLRLML